MMDRASSGIKEVPYCFLRSTIQFQGHTGQTRLLGWSQLSNPSDLPCFPQSVCPSVYRLHGFPRITTVFFNPGIVVVCICLYVSVRPCVNLELVRAITHHPLKLGSPNLDHRCKRPWLRSLFWGDWPWLSRSNLTSKSKFTPFWACPCHNSPPIEVTISKFGTKMHLSTVQIPTNFGIDWNWSSIQFLISNPDQIELFMYIVGIL